MQGTLKDNKTISDVLQEFFKEQEAKLKPSTLKKYEDVLYLFKECMNGYAPQYLDEKETKKFEKYYNANGDSHREFCDIFGPDKIFENVDEFVNYFMIRKVCASKELMKSVGTVIKKLGKWLLEKQYIDSEDGQNVIDVGAESSVMLPACEEFREMLEHCIYYTDDDIEPIEGHFSVDDVKEGTLYLSCLDSTEKDIVIKVPKPVSDVCKTGWRISGEIVSQGKRFFFTDVWNVYP